MHTCRAILIQTLATACFVILPVAGHAVSDPAAAISPVAAATNAPAASTPRPPRRLEEDELRSLLAAALNQRQGPAGGEWELRLTRPWTTITVPDEPLTLEILEPTFNRITSNCILRFDLRVGQKTLGSWQAPVQARLWRQTLVAHAPLRRGQILREADFTRERCDLLLLRDPLADLPAQASAYELAETVSAGAPLTARAIRLKPVLARGQTADAIIRDGAMVISLKVEVLEEGVPGQIVRVRNPQSHRELRGKVFDEQTVEIAL
jgi:flagella basal body P-ring formation protein FlgA